MSSVEARLGVKDIIESSDTNWDFRVRGADRGRALEICTTVLKSSMCASISN